jgi:hypothetical protein
MDDELVADGKRYVTAWIVERYLGAAWPHEMDSIFQWRVISPELVELDIRFSIEALQRPESWLAEQLEAIAADASAAVGSRQRRYLVVTGGLIMGGG